jgi:hypothetical protein
MFGKKRETVYEHVQDIVSYYDAEIAFWGGIGILSIVGLFPRIGMVRCLTIRYKNKFRPVSHLSRRTEEVVNLQRMVKFLNNSNFIGIAGSKRVGRTTLVNTALADRAGVVFVKVRPFVIFCCSFVFPLNRWIQR